MFFPCASPYCWHCIGTEPFWPMSDLAAELTEALASARPLPKSKRTSEPRNPAKSLVGRQGLEPWTHIQYA